MPKRMKVFQGQRLRLQRELMQLSQEDLAAQIQISQPQLNGYENDKAEPSPALLRRMAQILGVTTDYLLGLVENRHQEIRVSDLSADEQEIFDALRDGRNYEAIRLIAERGSKSNEAGGMPGPFDRTGTRP